MKNRSDIVGLTRLKNKVKKNAFDLSHRHMFTYEIGELLPVFYQWVNPNETFKIGYNGLTRTTPLQTAAFTRLRENIQYYFVPFQSLWKYFEGNINNMTVGQSGENVSRIAQGPTSNSDLGTGMPYVNYNFLRETLGNMLTSTAQVLITYSIPLRYDDAMSFLRGELYLTSDYRSDVFTSDGDYRYLSSRNTLRINGMAKLLNALGYGNFVDVMSYDLITALVDYGSEKQYATFDDITSDELGTVFTATSSQFFGSKYGIKFDLSKVSNMPNLSIFPLLAYHKIINDHYRYLQWQPYQSFLCNIDYIKPTDSMNFGSLVSNIHLNPSIFDMSFSNLSLDYFNGVLPRAQYGDESSAIGDVQLSSFADAFSVLPPVSSSYTGSTTASGVGSQLPSNVTNIETTGDNSPIRVGSVNVQLKTAHTHPINLDNEDALGKSSLKISALRSALALQKYKEIQNSNDPDFASQVLAHFGIKPKHDDYNSDFIGGGDTTIDINPVVNQNLSSPDASADIKAIATGTLSAGCKFHSDTYGIIIGIYRCTPMLDFSHVGIDRNLFKTDASDFPLPELDSIGMQTQYRCELASPGIARKLDKAQSVFASVNIDMSKTYGFLPRYSELKTSFDRVDGAFNTAYSSWVTGYTPKLLELWSNNLQSAGSQTDFSGISQFLRCNPDLCYNLFLNQRSGSVNDDKLLIGSVNTCVAVRPFSKYGLPYEN